MHRNLVCESTLRNISPFHSPNSLKIQMIAKEEEKKVLRVKHVRFPRHISLLGLQSAANNFFISLAYMSLSPSGLPFLVMLASQ